MKIDHIDLSATFCFECGPHLECFTLCCRKLRLVLTPYDVIVLRRFLGIGSAEFLENYCDLSYGEGIFPFYFLRMSEERGGICPFLTKEGCSVYPARPAACRLYPVGRGFTFRDGQKNMFFIIKEDHCLGHQRRRGWTTHEWLKHEGLEEYDRINKGWMELVASPRTPLTDKFQERIKMFLMASYNLDRFREFVFGTRFLDSFSISQEERLALTTDDLALLSLGVNWLEFVLFGEGSLKPKIKALSGGALKPPGRRA